MLVVELSSKNCNGSGGATGGSLGVPINQLNVGNYVCQVY
jgi:hypothetical protein